MERKILLLIPNYSWFGKRKWNTLPFAIPILASILKNYNLEIIDANINNYSEKELAGILIDKAPEIVLISVISYDYSKIYHKMTEIVKKTVPNSTVVMGGVYVTTCIEHVMEDPNIDIGMMGHAEERICPLIDAIIRGDMNEIKSMEGIAYRSDNKVIINPLITNVADVEKMVKPDYSKTAIKQYVNQENALATNFVNESKKHFANILTSYGCPYNCLFCASRSISGRKVVVRPADDVLEELEYLVNECNIELLNIMDDNI
ncbi:MAG: cobalamin-dependent protein, partial [Lachnospiraceae bacterium]|nr:cobalamin-dependent protein [Lachnospiraceae bacterium]